MKKEKLIKTILDWVREHTKDGDEVEVKIKVNINTSTVDEGWNTGISEIKNLGIDVTIGQEK